MSVSFTLALAQIDTLVGDLDGNLERVRALRARAAAAGARIVVFPELALCGYPPEDLVLKTALTDYAARLVARLAAETADGGPAVILGVPWREPGWAKPRNSAVVLDGGRLVARIDKHALPNYGVFDEVRVFEAGPVPGPVRLPLAEGGSVRVGVMICEDMWVEDVAEGLAESGAELLVVINGSPFELGKADVRLQMAAARVTESGLPLAYVNQVGGQDELVFDGGSFAMTSRCRLVAQAPFFEEDLLLVRFERDATSGVFEPGPGTIAGPPPAHLESIYRAMMLGLRDYVDKNRFPGVVLGLSGGIDSALSAVVAVDALGAERVWALFMPSRFSSQESRQDAEAVANNLGIRFDVVPIEAPYAAFLDLLAPLFSGRPFDVTEENIQARIRGLILMAVSNKFGPMLLTTGNKSEMSVGYATLYGDMCGGFSVLKDVYKTTVFELARWRNEHLPKGGRGPATAVIPERVLTKPPSAELRPGQRDEDTLPPYPVLDAILKGLIEEDLAPPDLVARGFDPETVRRVSVMLDTAEYKRRQAPPGVKITRRAFGRDRRYPITNAFRHTGIVRGEPAPTERASQSRG
ncbi:Glutamine-dependent NAD(+) synthetase [bacterium HR40]|nr:Glutamine-dependent NAD(+) synthetase [bacterium HR40]